MADTNLTQTETDALLAMEKHRSKWAFPVSGNHFPNPNNAWQTLQDFMRYCNIVEPPMIQRGLFT